MSAFGTAILIYRHKSYIERVLALTATVLTLTTTTTRLLEHFDKMGMPLLPRWSCIIYITVVVKSNIPAIIIPNGIRDIDTCLQRQ